MRAANLTGLVMNFYPVLIIIIIEKIWSSHTHEPSKERSTTGIHFSGRRWNSPGPLSGEPKSQQTNTKPEKRQKIEENLFVNIPSSLSQIYLYSAHCTTIGPESGGGRHTGGGGDILRYCSYKILSCTYHKGRTGEVGMEAEPRCHEIWFENLIIISTKHKNV